MFVRQKPLIVAIKVAKNEKYRVPNQLVVDSGKPRNYQPRFENSYAEENKVPKEVVLLESS